SVTADRTFSMSTGLDASTVTPGITAPVVSLTTPAMLLPLCAEAAVAIKSTAAITSTHAKRVLRTQSSWSACRRTLRLVRLKADPPAGPSFRGHPPHDRRNRLPGTSRSSAPASTADSHRDVERRMSLLVFRVERRTARDEKANELLTPLR